MLFFDAETWPIAPGLQAPPVVCGQWSTPEGPALALAPEFRQRIVQALQAETVAGHSVAYDMAAIAATWPEVLPLIFQAYAEGRVTCTYVREKLLLVAAGREHSGQKYDLAGCLDRAKIPHAFKTEGGKKAETWRTRYSELRDTPPDQWPEDARRYAQEDVRGGEALYLHQERHAPAGWLEDQHRRARADFWLTLAAAWGMRTDQEHVHRLAQATSAEAVTLRASLQKAGLVRSNGVKDTKAARLRMIAQRVSQGLPLPLTPAGKEAKKADPDSFPACILQAAGDFLKGPRPGESDSDLGKRTIALTYVSTTVDACAETGDQTLIDYARFGSLSKLKGRIKRLAAAGALPIQTRFNVILKTGRTSSTAGKSKAGEPVSRYGDQIQNLDRAPGVRECYRARPGFVLLSVDYSAAELHTLAQVCLYLGLDSTMAKVLNSGKDIHLWFGALMKGWTYEWAKANKSRPEVKAARQMAKAANFGFPGGLGVLKFRLFALGTYGVRLTDQEAKDLKAAWFAAFPEMVEYFAHVNALIESGEPLRHFTSLRYRGGASYCAACNSYFQGLAADMALDAGFDVSRECYTGDGILRGSRIVDFIHDELLLEVPVAIAHECAERVVHLMEEAGRRWCPGVSPGAEPALSWRWRKKAEPVYLDGRLIPWEDREVSQETVMEIREARTAGDLIPLSWKYGLEVERIRTL